MKKQLLTLAAIAGMAISGFSQGSIFVDNSANFANGTDATATTGGQFFLKTGATVDVIGQDFNLTLLSSSTQTGTYTPFVTFLASGNGAGGNLLPGTFVAPDGNAVTIPGTAVNGSVYIMVEAWLGTAASYDLALAAGNVAVGASSGFLVSSLGGIPTTGNPVNPPDISGMPAVTLAVPVAAPEPGTFALAGLGAAAMLVFRRRK